MYMVHGFLLGCAIGYGVMALQKLSELLDKFEKWSEKE